MPGPVAQAHSEVEEDCSSCHTVFATGEQVQLCVDCHEDVGTDIESSQGFHGKQPTIATAECATCHADHLGREADITGLIPDTFDHSLTDFPLEDAHSIQACDGCHVEGTHMEGTEEVVTKFRDAPSECYTCHEADDAHNGRLGEECQQCHEPKTWLDTQFDHEEETDYALLGAHGEQPCAACHIDQHYEDTPTLCIDCHKLDDVHAGSRGNDCQDCHTEKDWKTTRFKHFKETGFELEGSHAELTCNACHLDNMALETPPTECVGCHSSNDVHQGSRGSECAECHNTRDWEIDFDHERENGFALLGAHNELRCEQCHTGAVTDPLPDTCEQCHDEDDPHNGTLGACDSCHSTSAWAKSLRFDHEFTDYPLFGLHRLATCEQCHLSQQYDEADGECFDCHVEDNPHNGTFGEACADCHNPGGWDLWRFDHDSQTAFALSGSHADLQCDACHSPSSGVAGNLSQQCGNCHLTDDIHNGQFGDRCERCHSTESFSDSVRFR